MRAWAWDPRVGAAFGQARRVQDAAGGWVLSLLADGATQEQPEERRWPGRLAVMALVGRTREGTLARQLQPYVRQVLDALVGGEARTPRLYERRAAVVRASWRQRWEAPTPLVESREPEEPRQLPADRVADLVLVASDELPRALALSPSGVPGLGCK